MVKQEIIKAVRELSNEGRIRWMLDLGYQLTVAARSSYRFEGHDGSLQGLMGFNEIQHRVFARARDLEHGRDWTIDSFVEMVFERGTTFGIAEDVVAALRGSLQSLDPLQ